MDVGARFCRRAPKCAGCPARRTCAYAIRDGGRIPSPKDKAFTGLSEPRVKPEKFVGSRRYYRGRAIRALAGAPALSLLALGEQVMDGFATTDLPWLRELLAELERDGLVMVDARRDRAALP